MTSSLYWMTCRTCKYASPLQQLLMLVLPQTTPAKQKHICKAFVCESRCNCHGASMVQLQHAGGSLVSTLLLDQGWNYTSQQASLTSTCRSP